MKAQTHTHGEGGNVPILAKAKTLAQLLDCSLRHITYMAEKGVLRPIKMGDRCVRYDVAESVERLKSMAD